MTHFFYNVFSFKLYSLIDNNKDNKIYNMNRHQCDNNNNNYQYKEDCMYNGAIEDTRRYSMSGVDVIYAILGFIGVPILITIFMYYANPL